MVNSDGCLLFSNDDVGNGNPFSHSTCRRAPPPDAIQEWVKDEGSLDNEDLLLFLTFGQYRDRYLAITFSLVLIAFIYLSSQG